MAAQWQVDYDQRQYLLMEDRLRRYETGTLDLGSVIGDLDALISCLEAADETLKDSLRAPVNQLEEIYAWALYEVEQRRSANIDDTLNEPDNRRLIAEVVAGIRRILAERMAQPTVGP